MMSTLSLYSIFFDLGPDLRGCAGSGASWVTGDTGCTVGGWGAGFGGLGACWMGRKMVCKRKVNDEKIATEFLPWGEGGFGLAEEEQAAFQPVEEAGEGQVSS